MTARGTVLRKSSVPLTLEWDNPRLVFYFCVFVSSFMRIYFLQIISRTFQYEVIVSSVLPRLCDMSVCGVSHLFATVH